MNHPPMPNPGFFFFLAVLGINFRALHMPDKCSITELHLQLRKLVRRHILDAGILQNADTKAKTNNSNKIYYFSLVLNSIVAASAV